MNLLTGRFFPCNKSSEHVRIFQVCRDKSIDLIKMNNSMSYVL